MTVKDLPAAVPLPDQREGIFDFLALAPELRNDVYRYFFVYDKPCVAIISDERWQTAATVSSPRRLVPNKPASDDTLPDTTTKHAILRTSRQSHNEAAATLYSEKQVRTQMFRPQRQPAKPPLRQSATRCSSIPSAWNSVISKPHGLLEW